LIGARIDFGEQVAFLDHLAFLEIRAQQLPGDLRADRHVAPRCDRAERVERDADIAAGHLDDTDRHRWRIRARCAAASAETAAALRLCRCAMREKIAADRDHQRADHDAHDHQQTCGTRDAAWREAAVLVGLSTHVDSQSLLNREVPRAPRVPLEAPLGGSTALCRSLACVRHARGRLAVNGGKQL
jgi:hypothetical protein